MCKARCSKQLPLGRDPGTRSSSCGCFFVACIRRERIRNVSEPRFFYSWGKWAESEKREARSERDVGLGLEGERKDRTCRNARTLISVKKLRKGVF